MPFITRALYPWIEQAGAHEWAREEEEEGAMQCNANGALKNGARHHPCVCVPFVDFSARACKARARAARARVTILIRL